MGEGLNENQKLICNIMCFTATVPDLYKLLLLLLLVAVTVTVAVPAIELSHMAVVLTLVQTKQIRINIHKQNNKKTQYKQYKTQ